MFEWVRPIRKFQLPAQSHVCHCPRLWVRPQFRRQKAGPVFQAAPPRGATTARTLSISARFGADRRSVVALLSFLFEPERLRDTPFLQFADRLRSQRGGSLGNEFRGDEFQTQRPIQSRRRRPKLKSQRTNCRSQIFRGKLRQRAPEQARSREWLWLEQLPAV